MTKTTLILFWVLWLLDVLAALYAHREFLTGLFGQYSAPSPTFILMWVALLAVILAILFGSIYFKNHGSPTTALMVAAAPLVLALPYLLWMGMILIMRPNWR
jgi:hypothetical protein